MGPDMYLSRKTYVQNWDYQKPEQRHTIAIGGPKASSIKAERISYIEEQVAYWRKANQIHAWFVENCQEGRDECQETYVPREKLAALLAAVNEVLETAVVVDGAVVNGYSSEGGEPLLPNLEPGKIIANAEVAESILPNRSGFFFGSTDYDEYYLEDLRSTQTVLTELLAEDEDGDFYYHASW